MARMTGPDCAVMCNSINTHTHTQPQDQKPYQDHCIMLRTKAQGREARGRIGEDRREAKKRKKPQTSCRRNVGNGGD